MYFRHAYDMFVPYAQRSIQNSVPLPKPILIFRQTFLLHTTRRLSDYSEPRERKLLEKRTATNLEWGVQSGYYLERAI